jgi:hypothetical protein
MENLNLDATERKRISVTMWLTAVLAVTALFQATLSCYGFGAKPRCYCWRRLELDYSIV